MDVCDTAAHLVVEAVVVIAVHGHPVQQHLPRGRLVEVLQQRHAGGLATPTRSHQRHHLAWPHSERQVLPQIFIFYFLDAAVKVI